MYLKISVKGQKDQFISLSERAYTIGRTTENDIVINHPVVSRHHARLDYQDGDWFYKDLGSRNGSHLGKRPFREGPLQKDQVLTIGHPERRDVIVMMSHQGEDRSEVHIQTDSDGWIKLGLIRPQPTQILLGRSSDCDFVLPAPMVSRRHASLLIEKGGLFLTDLNSSNGTFLGGIQIRGKQRLGVGDVVQIGSFRLKVISLATIEVWIASQGMHLEGRNVLIKVRQAGQEKVILDHVNISCRPRELIGLVGGSGAGKTTLMKALSGILPPDGEILVEGDNLYAQYELYRSMIGYVPQDDILHQDLTVEQALRYSAKLRLPSDVGAAEIETRVSRVLEQVELSGQREQTITSLSGGQRKRASIAVELLADPPLLFLDEPTSGLDPSLEKKMMLMLRRLADQGKTILVVTHATANIKLCDQVAFMSGGKMVYFGSPKLAENFFDVPQGDFGAIYDAISDSEPAEAARKALHWSDRFNTSSLYRSQQNQRLSAPSQKTASTSARLQAQSYGQRGSMPRQFAILVSRYFELILRDRILISILFLIMPLIAGYLLLITGPAWLTGNVQEMDADLSLVSKLGLESRTFTFAGNSQALVFMMALSSILLGLFASSYEIVKEQTIYARERMVFLKLVPYLGSKVFLLGIFAAMQIALFLFVLGTKIRFPTESVTGTLPVPVEMFLTLFLGALGAIMMGLLISAVAPNATSVSYFILGIMFIQILFAGVLFKLPGTANTISYLTFSRWTTESLGMTIDLDGLNTTYSKTRIDLGPRNEMVTTTIKQPAEDWKCVDITQEYRSFPGCTQPVPVPVVKENKLVEVEKEHSESIEINPKPEVIDTPLEFTLSYEPDPARMAAHWLMQLLFFAVLFLITLATLRQRDIV